jgi:hypothetical protein
VELEILFEMTERPEIKHNINAKNIKLNATEGCFK